LIVEFVGVPGAGKSTASEAATQLLRDRGYAFEQVDDLRFVFAKGRGSWLIAKQANPRLAFALMRSTPIRAWRSDRSAWNRLLHRDWTANRLEPQKLVASGVLFGAANAVRTSHVTAARIGPHLTPPDAVIDLRLDSGVAVGRIRERADNHPAISLSQADALQFVRDYRAAFDEVMNFVKSPVLTIEVSDTPPSEVASAAADFVQSVSTM